MPSPIVLPDNVPADSPIGRYLAHLVARAQAHGVALIMAPTPTLAYQGQEQYQVSGYFVEQPRPTLAVATGKPFEEWLQICVHEGCHMDQWIERDPSWIGNTLADGREAVDWLDAWCSRDLELDADVLADVIARAKAVELDCEKRAVATLVAFGLPVDLPTYIQRANAYVQFYDHVGRIRAWNAPGQAPYQREQVWRQAPTVFLEAPDARLTAAFIEHYPAAAPRLAPRP